MITIRKAEQRGHSDRGWLNSYHTFSFADYHDPQHMGFRVLRVLNDDRVAPGRGFGAHAHRDMEILSYVMEGSLVHRDSMGELHTFGPNTIQSMSAGTGVVHSEFNGSRDEPVHFLQIWIEPAVEDVAPSYQQVVFDPREKQGRFRLLAGPEGNGSQDAVRIHQDARVYVAELAAGQSVKHSLGPDRNGWVQVARGDVCFNGQMLREGDGAAITGEQALSFAADGPQGTEFLLFDLP
jgi:redox-sensitive bicupin YhaK (pirin superfamily)